MPKQNVNFGRVDINFNDFADNTPLRTPKVHCGSGGRIASLSNVKFSREGGKSVNPSVITRRQS